MITYSRLTSVNNDYNGLTKLLDQELAITDGDDHAFYDQFNKSTHIKHIILAYDGDEAVACGALKAYDDKSMEVKRMFTKEKYRGQGIAGQLLNRLEIWTKELGYQQCMLETGIRQYAAIALYEKKGYSLTQNYGQYEGIEESRCFRKMV